MAIKTSGTLSMSDIHVEAAGSPYAHNGTSSLNDSDIRALYPASGYSINSTLGTTISIGDFYGASKTPTGWTLTEGGTSGSSFSNYGFSISSNFGSISPTTYNSATIQGVYSNSLTIKGSVSYSLYVQANGNQSTSWFSSISIAGTSHAQSSFSRSYNSNTNITTWTKSISGHIFDGTGTTAVVFS